MMVLLMIATFREAWEPMSGELSVTVHTDFVEFEEIEIDDILIFLISRMSEHACGMVK